MSRLITPPPSRRGSDNARLGVASSKSLAFAGHGDSILAKTYRTWGDGARAGLRYLDHRAPGACFSCRTSASRVAQARLCASERNRQCHQQAGGDGDGANDAPGGFFVT